ncbi:MAG: DUF4184 family protein [Micrococcales bacterium]|nr:DUF4184 family protein [Micrococcales bacterium]
MPFTPAHVAAVLPLRGRQRLPFAALVAGCTSPDLPYFVPGPTGWSDVTHSLVGIVTWNLLLGLALWLVWRQVSPALHDTPAVVRGRWVLPPRSAAWWATVVAVLVGSSTHVVWDEFTHAGRFGATHVPQLAASWPSPVGSMPGWHWLQYASSVLGLAVLVWAGLRLPTVERGQRDQPRLARAVPFVVLACGAAASGLGLASGSWSGWRGLGFVGLTSFIGGACVGLVGACALHVALRRRQAREQV